MHEASISIHLLLLDIRNSTANLPCGRHPQHTVMPQNGHRRRQLAPTKRPLEVYCASVNKIRARMDGCAREHCPPVTKYQAGPEDKGHMSVIWHFTVCFQSIWHLWCPFKSQFSNLTKLWNIYWRTLDFVWSVLHTVFIELGRIWDDFCCETRGIPTGAAAPGRKTFSLILYRRIHTKAVSKMWRQVVRFC